MNHDVQIRCYLPLTASDVQGGWGAVLQAARPVTVVTSDIADIAGLPAESIDTMTGDDLELCEHLAALAATEVEVADAEPIALACLDVPAASLEGAGPHPVRTLSAGDTERRVAAYFAIEHDEEGHTELSWYAPEEFDELPTTG